MVADADRRAEAPAEAPAAAPVPPVLGDPRVGPWLDQSLTAIGGLHVWRRWWRIGCLYRACLVQERRSDPGAAPKPPWSWCVCPVDGGREIEGSAVTLEEGWARCDAALVGLLQGIAPGPNTAGSSLSIPEALVALHRDAMLDALTVRKVLEVLTALAADLPEQRRTDVAEVIGRVSALPAWQAFAELAIVANTAAMFRVGSGPRCERFLQVAVAARHASRRAEAYRAARLGPEPVKGGAWCCPARVEAWRALHPDRRAANPLADCLSCPAHGGIGPGDSCPQPEPGGEHGELAGERVADMSGPEVQG